MITRENYEEYFLLYVDNELSAAARSAIEKFVADNPHLREEWETLLQCRVDADHHMVFRDKETLLQQDLLSYVDGELDEEDRRSVEEFARQYPSKGIGLQQLLMTVSKPDLSISFPGKEGLYRSERRRLILMPWMQAGIAAAVLGLVALLLLTGQHRDTPGLVRNPAIKKNVPPAVTPAKPAPLYTTGSDDHSRDSEIANNAARDSIVNNGAARDEAVKNDRPGRNQQRKTQAVAPKEKAPEVAVQQQEPARTTTVPTTTDIRSGDPVLVAAVRADPGEKTLIKPATTVAAVNIPKEQSSFATQALLQEAQADESKEMVAAAPAGKNKLRGLFRKVSRTFGKTADRDDDGKKEVLISAFQVALK